jgi:hypothetical protein
MAVLKLFIMSSQTLVVDPQGPDWSMVNLLGPELQHVFTMLLQNSGKE